MVVPENVARERSPEEDIVLQTDGVTVWDWTYLQTHRPSGLLQIASSYRRMFKKNFIRNQRIIRSSKCRRKRFGCNDRFRHQFNII